jgi:UrcA family protein
MNMHKTITLKTRTASGLLVMTCFSALIGNVLAAAPDGKPPRQVVNFADLDVSRPQGIAILYRRIESAARGVCGHVSERELSQAIRWHVCLDEAIARAVSTVSLPALTRYYRVKTGLGDAPQQIAKQP